MAKAMKLNKPELYTSDEDLARELIQPKPHPADAFTTPGKKPAGAEVPLAGITLERLRAEGPVRLNLPTDYLPFATGYFPTPSGKCEIYSSTLKEMGIDPLPTYTPPAEDPFDNPLAQRFPLQMISPPQPSFLNSSFANVASLRRDEGEPTVEIHTSDAAIRNIVHGEMVQVLNDRGAYLAKAVVGENVKQGTVVSQGIWWREHTIDGKNANVTTSTRVTDLGGGATFFDNLVDVRKLNVSTCPK
jgi:anaerobic selenocysteine-containing dehydrogenase